MVNTVRRANGWLRPFVSAIPTPAKMMPLAYSFADQAFAVGGGFLANVALARTRTKEEYGMFALSYSVYIFLSGLHNAAILEPYTVYGSGRYRDRFSEYLRLIARSNAVICLLVTGILLLACLLLSWLAPQWMSPALLGLGVTVGVLLSGLLLRRVFYLQRQAVYAAMCSLVFFGTVACALWLMAKVHRLDSFSVFLVLAFGWIAAGTIFGRKLAFGKPNESFLHLEPGYWREHWNYTKWVLATAFVFQLTTQGYYWLVAGFLSAGEVGELRAMYLIVAPVEQALIAISYVVIPALAADYAANRMSNFISVWKQYALATVGITGLFALIVRVVGKPVIHIIYAGKFDGLSSLLFTLALLPLVMGIGSTMAQALNAVEKPRMVFFGFLSSGIATFLVGIPLVMHLGLRGASYGMLLSAGIYTAAMGIGFLFNVYNKARLQTALAPKQSVPSGSAVIRVAPFIGASRDFPQATRPAPIALFVYNRPEHTRRTLEALQKNELAQCSDLFVFADGPKNEGPTEAIGEVRKLIHNLKGFRAVTVIERERNLGLSKSIVDGVTQLCQEFGRAIVVEDDIVTAPDFLSFVNRALDRYVDEATIFSVCGFNYPITVPRFYPHDAFFSYRFACWGWGTWKDRWEKADWSVSDFPDFIANRERQKQFNRGGNDLSEMLARHVAGKLGGSWDIVWAYTHFKHDGAALLPVASRVYNVGLDGSGIHCNRPSFVQASLARGSDSDYRFPNPVEFDPHFVSEIQRVCHRSAARRAAAYLFDKLELR